MQNKKFTLATKILTIVFFLFSPCCLAQHITDITKLFDLTKKHQTVEVSMPFTVLKDCHYTNDLNIYKYKNILLKIINADNPKKIIFKVSRVCFRRREIIWQAPNLPWWADDAPEILKELDFSKIDGKLNKYVIDQDYQLTLLPHQGHWGKVYALEKISSPNSPPVCAVKLLLNRADRAISRKKFHQRHAAEIRNNITANTMPIAIQTYGIIKNDDDHYLMILEYGAYAFTKFALQNPTEKLAHLQNLLSAVNKMHMGGYAHGDLKINNMLFVNNQLKLCDWFSMIKIDSVNVQEYLYDGDNLPPEAIRAFYFAKRQQKNLAYATVMNRGEKAYWLHPIAADRFCLGMSILEILAPDLYKKFDGSLPKGFNPYNPDSLVFWPNYVKLIKNVQQDLQSLHKNSKIAAEQEILKTIVEFINLNPLQRKCEILL